MKIISFVLLTLVAATMSLADESAPAEKVDQPEARLVPFGASPVFANGHRVDPPSPEQMREHMKRAVETQNEMTKARLQSFSDSEMVTHFANFSRAYYEALIEAGFSKKEALQIVVSVGIPNFR
jgi:hypothetical protein